MNFYGFNIGKPLSDDLNKTDREWRNSKLGDLHDLSEGNVFLREVPRTYEPPTHVWRVVDAFFNDEDGLASKFYCLDECGNLCFATLGVHWHGIKSRIGGGFRFRPEFGNEYYPLIGDSDFVTVESGGYTVQVLDKDNPSEGLNFGLIKKAKHSAITVIFQLLPVEKIT